MAVLAPIKWWKATEIPLAERDWRKVKKYCTDRGDPWLWKNAVYFFRFSPPFTLAYGSDEKKRSSPLIYIGSGALQQRWQSHLKEWLNPLATAVPGGRYELWVFPHDKYKKVEADALRLFRRFYGRLPLANRSGGNSELTFDYPDTHALYSVAEQDRRYIWAMRPIDPHIRTQYFDKGWSSENNG